MNHRDQKGRTLLFHAIWNPSNNSKLIEDLLLTGLDPSAQDNTERTPPSLSVWGKRRPKSFSLLARDSGNFSAYSCGETILQHILQSYAYHIACLLLQYGLGSMLEDVDMHREWTYTLTLIGNVLNMPCNTSVSVEEGPLKLSNDPKDTLQLVGQTLLSLAALFRHEKAFRGLLDWGMDPSCPAIGEIRKKTSIVSQIGHCMSRQEPMDPKRESNNYRMSDELRQGPLRWAAYTGDSPLVQSILDRGLGPNIQNRKGQTALYFAVRQTDEKYTRLGLQKDKEEIVSLLLQKGALVTSADAYNGATLLAHAFKARYSKVATVLLVIDVIARIATNLNIFQPFPIESRVRCQDK